MSIKNKSNPLVSIIIPTFNCAENLDDCLRSIKKQNYKNIEVIIVNQGGKDGTDLIAKKYGAKIKEVHRPKFYSPPSKSRNLGAGLAKGEILFHLDSDMKLSPKLVSEFVNIIRNNKTVGACIVHEKDIADTFWGKCKALERACYWGNDNIESARVVRKKLFRSVKGYDEGINTGEDFNIHRKYKKISNIRFCHGTIFHNIKGSTFMGLIIKKYHYGKTAGIFFRKNNIPPYHLVFIEFACYIKNYKLLLSKPVFAVGMLVLKVCEYIAGLCGMITRGY